MVRNRIALCVLAGLVLVCTVAAQQNDTVLVTLIRPPPNELTLPDCWHGVLTNSGGPVTVYLHGYLMKGEEVVLSGYSQNTITLAHGPRTLTSQDITGVRDVHYKEGYKELTIRGGTAPEGDYSSCLEVYETGTNRKLGSQCIDVEVRIPGAPRLISPPDGAQLSEGQNNPMFAWTRPMPAPSGAVSFSIKMVEVMARQSREQAMQNNRAWFEQEGIQTTSLPYPTSAQRLEKGRIYAWQVTAKGDDGREIGKSEMWGLGLLATVPQMWCNAPHPDFCPYNRFTNGDFEDITGDPSLETSADINLAAGWGAIWTSTLATTLADLWCPNQAVSGSPPVYKPGDTASGVYAGCWIDNRLITSAGFREGMFNRLAPPIDVPLGQQYTFTFYMAPLLSYDTSKTAEIGVYAIYDPNNSTCPEPTGNYTPPNADFFGAGNTALLGKFQVKAPASCTMTSHSVQFDQSQFSTYTAPQITHIMITHTDDTTRGMWYVAFDNFCMCKTESIPVDSSVYCCPGPNLVNNGNFEQGLTGFTSTYHAVDLSGCAHPYTDTVRPRLYSVVTSAEAAEICDQWIARDHSACNDGNGEKFMVVNGKTNGSNSKRIWRQTVTTEKDSNYMFCAHFKNLAQCCFDIKPRVRIKLGSIATIPWTTIDVGPGECEWTVIKKQFKATGTSLTITIELSEHGNGDGNDLAVDDISLQKLHPAPLASTLCTFNYTYPPSDPAHFNLTFFQPDPPNEGGFSDSGSCDYRWIVCAEDAAGNLLWNTLVINPPQWQTYPSCTFPGYKGTSTLSGTDPGLFAFDTTYIVAYQVACSCLTARTTWWEVKCHPGLKAAVPTIRQVEEKALPAKSVARIRAALKQ